MPPISNPCLTFLLLVINFIYILFAFAFVVVGIHMVLDHGLILEISYGSIYLAGTYILILCGFILFLTSFIGIFGSVKVNRFLLIAFIILLIILFLLFFIGGILLLAYPSSVNDDVKNSMRMSLRDQYGKTRLYTDAWNLTQSKLRCCGVDDLGWSVYRGSYWDNVTNIDMNNRDLRIPVSNPFYLMVPQSCCWTLVDTQTGWPSENYRDIPRCQYFQFGPPNLDTGADNDAVNYRGCARAMQSFLGWYSRGLGGLAIFFIFMIIPGVILAIMALARSTKQGKSHTSDNNSKDANPNYNQDYPPEQNSFIPGNEREEDGDSENVSA